MEKDLNEECSDVLESGRLIVPASQVESQAGPAIDLPALQQVEEGSADSEIVYPVMDPSATQSGSVVLVADSEVEMVEKAGTSEDAPVIEETVSLLVVFGSEDNPEQGGGTSSSDDAVNVAVITRAGAEQDLPEDSVSQDLFAVKDEDIETPVATPSHHLATLQLSGQPMLVPETMEESLEDEEICPSPDVYSNMPHIIPSTPTAAGEEGEYNPEEIQTLNSQPGKPLKKTSSEQTDMEGERQTSAGTSVSASAAEGYMGPTLAADLPEWQQSQSLCLRLSSSGSQFTTQQPASQARQTSSQLQMAFRSQGLGASSHAQLGPIHSQNSPHHISEAFSLSLPKSGSVTHAEVTREVKKAAGEVTSISSSKESSTDISVSWGTAAKAPISIDMVHSHSQSDSDPTFKLERPEVSAGEKRAETEEGSQNIFQRTRQRTAATKKTSDIFEESEDFFAAIKKPEKPTEAQLLLSDSDSIPCSQNRPRYQLVKEEEERVEAMEIVEGEREPSVTDPFNVDTVMDSEPEDEGTQSYDVYPALSQHSSQSVLMTAGQTEDAQVPELLPSTAAVSPTLPPKGQLSEGAALSQASQQGSQSQPLGQRASQQSQPLSQRASQVAARLAQLSALNQQKTVSASQKSQTGSQGRTSSQPTVGQTTVLAPPVGSLTTVVSQRAGSRTRLGSQLAVSQTALSGQPAGLLLQAGVQCPQKAQVQKGAVARSPMRTGGMNQPGSQPAGDSSHSVHPASQVHSVSQTGYMHSVSQDRNSQQGPKPTVGSIAGDISTNSLPVEHGLVGGHGEVSQERMAASGQLPHPEADPYLFHSSQSQLPVEPDAATTSRADTSVSTLQTLRSRTRFPISRRRKLLVKKKPAMNPKGGMKSSSTDDGTVSRPAIKPTRKVKKGEKFTRLQKTTASEFKTPGIPTQSAAKGRDPLEIPAEVASQPNPILTQRQSTVRISAVGTSGGSEPLPSTSAAGEEREGGGDGQALKKRKSVEFSNTVRIGSPDPLHLSFSQQPSLSDSQSSDSQLEVTEITEFVMRYVHRRTIIRRYDKDGKMVYEHTAQEQDEPTLMEKNERMSQRRVACAPSPSRSGSTLTSGDLADISSSSLSSKTISGPSSLERAASSMEMSDHARLLAMPIGVAGSSAANASSTSGVLSTAPWRLSGRQSAPAVLAVERNDAPVQERSLGGRSMAVASPPVSFISPNQSIIERDDSRLEAVVTSSSSGRGSELLYSADKLSPSDVPCAQPPPQTALSSSSSGVVPPTADESSQQKQTPGTTTRSSRKSTRCAPADSSQEESRRSAKVTSSPESQSFRPGNDSGGFNVALSGARKKSPGSAVSGTSSGKAGHGSVSTPKQKPSLAKQQSSSQESSEVATTPVQVETVSKLDIGARVMCRWKDGFFYPAKFIGLNTGIGNKFKVLFEDGLEKTVRAVDLVMAQNLPLGQSVLVTGEDGTSDPGLIIRHIVDDSRVAEKGEVMYSVAMDDGSTRSVARCRRSQLTLSEDQASCLLSVEEYCAKLGETDLSLVNTADVSLDNVIQGKRLRTKGSPAVGVPRIKGSTSTVVFDDERSDDNSSNKKKAPSTKTARAGRSHDALDTPVADKSESASSSSGSKTSARKRKIGPVATSTPTPKQSKVPERNKSPAKAAQESISPLGGAVVSPETTKRPTRKARVGLFKNVKGPIPCHPGLFAGYTFLLTHVDKPPELLAEEKQQLQSGSTDTSAEENTDDGSDTTFIPFDKDHLVAQIEAGGGSILSKLFPSSVAGTGKKLFLLADTYQRTIKYFQSLAANLPIVSHTWITHSCVQNELLDYKSYMLPAGISLERHVIMERRTTTSCLAGHRVLLTSSKADYLEAWSTVLEMAQCKVFHKFASNAAKNRPGVDVVVTDDTCVKSIKDKARQLGVPVVSSEWLIQSLITNTLPVHDAIPAYSPDYYK